MKTKNTLVNVLLTILNRGVWGVSKALSRKFQKPLLRRSLVDWVDYSNSNNPYPAQKKFMLKNYSVIFNYFQTAFQTPLTPHFGAYHD